VLQAGAMAQGGDVFVLDMGKPMRIDDLARRMVRLSGSPSGTTTTRTATSRSPTRPATGRETVRRAADRQQRQRHRASDDPARDGTSLPWAATQRMLQNLLVMLGQFDVKGARDILLETVAEYRPSTDLVDLVWGARQAGPSEPSPRWMPTAR